MLDSSTHKNVHEMRPSHVVPVFLVCRLPLSLSVLHSAIDRSEHLSVAGCAGSIKRAAGVISADFSGVVVVISDRYRWIELEAIRELLSIRAAEILLVASHVGGHLPQSSLSSGVKGLLTQQCGIETLYEAIAAVARGEVFIGDDIREGRNESREREKVQRAFALLSSREREIMLQVVCGAPIGDIAKRLFLSPKTVSTYRYRVFDKLSVANDAALTRLACEHGLIEMNASSRYSA